MFLTCPIIGHIISPISPLLTSFSVNFRHVCLRCYVSWYTTNKPLFLTINMSWFKSLLLLTSLYTKGVWVRIPVGRAPLPYMQMRGGLPVYRDCVVIGRSAIVTSNGSGRYKRIIQNGSTSVILPTYTKGIKRGPIIVIWVVPRKVSWDWSIIIKFINKNLKYSQ